MKKFSSFLALLLCALSMNAQNIEWQFHSYHAVDFNLYQAYAITQTLDNGYVYAGRSGTNGLNNADFYLAKLDSGGNELWSRIYAGTSGSEARDIRESPDGSLIVSGFTVNIGDSSSTIYQNFLMKVNQDGDSLWTKRYYSGAGVIVGDGLGSSMALTYDGGFVITGKYASAVTGNDFLIIKTDASGDTLWTRRYGGSGSDIPRSIIQTKDSGFAMAGTTKSFGPNAGTGNMWLVRMNSMGDTLWTKVYGGINEEECYSVKQTTDGGYILAGRTGDISSDSSDIYVIKTNSTGSIQWTKTFGTPYDDYGRGIILTNDGGYALTGYVTDTAGPFSDVTYLLYVLKIDGQGNKQWDEQLGSGNTPNGAQGFCIYQCADGSLIVSGQDDPDSLGSEDIRAFIVKISSSSTGISSMNKVLQTDIYPNPSSGNSLVQVASAINDKVEMELEDETGRIIWSKEEDIHAGNNFLPVSIVNEANGIYFLSIKGNGVSTTEKIILER